MHVVPRLAFAAQYGVPPVDFVPAAESNTYETAVQRAEQFIIDRFVRAMPSSVRAPVVHIIKVRWASDRVQNTVGLSSWRCRMVHGGVPPTHAVGATAGSWHLVLTCGCCLCPPVPAVRQ